MKKSLLPAARIPSVFFVCLMFLISGISNSASGQNISPDGSSGILKKESRIIRAGYPPASALPAIVADESLASDEETSGISQQGEPVDAPLATRTASVSGNWNSTTTWGGLSVPTSADAVTINSGITVTVNVAAVCSSITFAAVNASSAITISGTNSLTVSGGVIMPRPATSQTCTINVNAGSLSIGTTLTMSATTSTRNDVINVTTGTLTVAGNITCGTTGCIFNLSGTGTMNFGGTFSSTPTLTTVTGSTVNYTGASAQTILVKTYSGNLGLSGAGTKTIAASTSVTVAGNITNSSTLVLTAGTSTTSTWLEMGGNLTNTGTINASASYIRFSFSSANAQTFTNNGTVTAPLSSFDVSNTNVSGLTLAGNGFVVSRANLFSGVVYNSDKITLGNGGTTTAVVQRGVEANTSPAGSFNVSPSFNIGSGGLYLLYDNGSVAYNTGYEIPSSHNATVFYLFDAADVTLTSDLSLTEELNFYGGTGTPTLRVGSNTLTLGGGIIYTVAGAFYGGATSNLVLNSSTTLNSIVNGLNNLTINHPGGIALGGAVTVNGTLTLSDGLFSNGAYLTLGNSATISRSAGLLSAAPSFGTGVDVVYTGASAINTGYEIPTSSTVLNDLTTHAGGVLQSGTPTGGTVSTLYTQGFEGAPADWTTEIVTNPTGTVPAISYVTSTSSTYPTIAPSQGTQCVQFNSYYCESGDQLRLKKSTSPLSTIGNTNVTVVFDWYVDAGYSTAIDYVTVQWSLNGTTWSNSTTYYRYSATAGWVTQNCVLPIGAENQTTVYVAFLFTSLYGNNCHLDNMKVNVTTPTAPVPSTYTINGTLDLANGTYAIGSGNSLVLNGDISGSNAIAGSSTSNLSVGGSGANLVIPSISSGLNNFTISRTNGVTLKSDATVNGVLTLTTNPSDTKGNLDMLDGSTIKTLTMGASATTVGAGDVTGIVSRNTFAANVDYTFGNQYTTISFIAGGTYPTQIRAKIAIGAVPSWKSAAIERVYDFVQTGGAGCYATIGTHYLDSELNGNQEDELVQFTYDQTTLYEWGRSNYNTTNNWVTISNVAIAFFPTGFGQLENTLSKSELSHYTWDGSASSVWTTNENWTPTGVPSSLSNVVIPDASTTPNDPTLPGSVELRTLTIEANGILNAAASEVITLNGDNGAWSNNGGIFNPATSTVTFTNANATISGVTNFHNLTIASSAALTPTAGNIMRIAGTLTNGGILRCVVLNNTVEYNGSGTQTVINPNGTTTGYSSLILSGSGTKTLPSGTLSIAHDFTTSGTASATAVNAMTIGGNVVIGSGTTFDLGSYSHSIGGNLANNGGTFTPSTSTVTLNGTGTQTITNSSGMTFNNLTISNTSANIALGTSTDCTIGGNLTINSGSVFDLAGNRLTAVTGTLSNSGTVKTQSTSATPVPSGKTWGGTFEYSGSGAQTIVEGTYNNLTMSGSGGATAAANITVDGVLSLTSANPSSTKGILDMGTNTVLMGATATTTGQGDVTGIIQRTSIAANTTYTFGNQLTTVNFPAVGTLPSQMSLKVTIGSAPTWRTGAVQRYYDLIQTGGSGTQAVLYNHYLESELNGNDESLLVFWVRDIGTSISTEYGRSAHSASENWVMISNVNIGVFSSSFGAKEIAIDESEVLELTWNGSTSTSWVTVTNWTPNAAPSSGTILTIPDAATTDYDPIIPGTATCGTMKIETGGILNSTAGAQLTVNGGVGAWINNGTFNPGTSTVIFTNANAVMSGTSDLYNLTVNTGAVLYLEDFAYLGLTGTLTNNGTFRTVIKGSTTVEYKGGSQTVVVPNPATNRYSNLVLSGSGTKTMPGTALNIEGDFTLSGTASVTFGAAISAFKNFTIGSGTTLTAGSYSHSIGGNFSNSGSLTATGSTFTFNGTAAQTIGGTSASLLNNVTIDNATGLTLTTDAVVTASGTLLINSGKLLTIDAGKKLTVTGTLTNAAGASGLVVKSGGSLIQPSGSVAATVEREINAWGPGFVGYHFLSSPVAAQAINPEFVPGTPPYGTTEDFYAWDEATNTWVNFKNSVTAPTWNTANVLGGVSGAGNFIPGKGYLVEYQDADTKQFSGTLNIAGVSLSNFTIASGSNRGWHLLGNPYQSALSWGTTAWALNNINATAKIWDEAGAAYTDISEGGPNTVIPSLNGFMVQVNEGFSGNNSLTIPASERVHSATAWYKSGTASCILLTASDLIGQTAQQSVIRFEDAATQGFDPAFDAHFLPGYAPLFYSVSHGEQLSTIALPEAGGTVQIPFDFIKNSGSVFTIEASMIRDVYGPVVLKDLKTGTSQDLTIDPVYFFTADDGDNPARFLVTFSHVGTSETAAHSPFIFYSSGNSIVVSGSGLTSGGSLLVYNMMGQMVGQQQFEAGRLIRIGLHGSAGYYLVKIMTREQTYTGKVFVNP